jgi:hypothetical protein
LVPALRLFRWFLREFAGEVLLAGAAESDDNDAGKGDAIFTVKKSHWGSESIDQSTKGARSKRNFTSTS